LDVLEKTVCPGAALIVINPAIRISQHDLCLADQLIFISSEENPKFESRHPKQFSKSRNDKLSPNRIRLFWPFGAL